MSKFVVGDIVCGISGSPYSVTNIQMTKGEVIHVYPSCSITVRVLDHLTRPREIGEEYDVNEVWFEKTDGSKSNKKTRKVKCCNCHKETPITQTEKASNGKYVCFSCSEMDRKWENNTLVHRPTSSHKTYGFELECVPKSDTDYLSMINSTYRIIPTSDGSLPDDGVEFKTPTYNGLRGLRRLFKSFDKYIDCSDSRCGSHINIGDTQYIHDQKDVLKIREHMDAFAYLSSYMQQRPRQTKDVCGRYFTGWADCNKDIHSHGFWINTNHDNRIEFRLSKFKTPKQYYELTCMWTEILDIAIDAWLKPERVTLSDTEVGQKFVDIFKRYVNRKARCQKDSRIVA